MELPAAGEHVFAVESIEKKRSRKVGLQAVEGHFYRTLSVIFFFMCFSLIPVDYMFCLFVCFPHQPIYEMRLPCTLHFAA